MKRMILALTIVLLLAVNIGHISTAYSATSAKDATGRQFIHKNLTGAEDLDMMSTSPAVPYFGGTLSPGHEMGITVYDYQHNGTMGRQVAHQPFTDYVHFTWMRWETAGGDRYLRYNAWNLTAGSFAWGTGVDGGKQFGDVNGGYTTCDVTASGSVVVSGHWGPSEDVYGVHADVDGYPSGGLFTFLQGAPAPPTCENWNTGGNEVNNQYVWPVVAWQDSAGVDIIHAIAVEFAAELISTMVYYRSVGGGDGDWPECGTAIDSIYDTAPVVRVNHTNPGELAIVWLKPAYYGTDPNDPCGQLQWQNDVVYMKSFDYGNTWESMVNVTDYTQGGAVTPDQLANGMAYTELSAMYDTGGKLHIVWNTALHDLTGSTPCEPEDQQSRIWHWDDGPSGCISIVFDAARPSNGINPGAFNLSATKMNISECLDTLLDVSRMYVSFTRFGALTDATGNTCIDNSDGFFSNGEIFLTGSVDGGVTWGEAQNLTNTPTPDCEAGDCESDHWSSMAMYSVDSVHIQYINDKDAGGFPQGEGEATQSPVMYLSVPCFTPATFCNIGYTPTSIGYPTWIAPNDGSADCTGDIYYTFDLILTNTGNEPTAYSVTSNADWLTPASASGSVPAGCNNSETWQFTFGPIVDEGVYHTTMDIEACGGAVSTVVNVDLYVFCDFFVPESELLSTACWSVGVWNVPRAGLSTRSEKGNMWWFEDSSTFMYDEGVVITYANDTTNTSFSLFDGSDSRVEFRAQGLLVTADSLTYEFAEGLFSTQDTAIIGTIKFYVPKHPDTCVMVERVEICNNTTASMTLHVGEGIDWDIPDGAGGSENQCSADEARQEVYQFGPSDADPEVNYYATVGVCGGIAGAIVLENDEWVYSNEGYNPAEIGGLLARLSSFIADNPDTAQDMNSFYAIKQNVTLAPGACYKFCKVKASSKTGVAGLQALIDKGKQWIQDNGLDCPGCEPGPQCMPGDADQSGWVDIDDVVWIFSAVCFGGPSETPCEDVDGNCFIDGFDLVYLIHYIFTGGPAPLPPPCNDPPIRQDAGMQDVVEMAPYDAYVSIGESFSIPIFVGNDEGISKINFDRIFAQYTSGTGVLTCDSVTYWGTRLDGDDQLSLRSFSASDFGTSAGGYISLSMEAQQLIAVWPYQWEDSLDHGWGDIARVWFTAISEGEADLQCTLENPILAWSIFYPHDYDCFTPIISFGRIFVSGDDDVNAFESSTDPAFVPTPAGSHPFVVTLRNFMGDPIEGSTDVSVQIINSGKALILCPTQTEFPVLSPVSPSDADGRAMFYLAAGNCVPGCEAVVSCLAGEIARVPVRPVDANGDLLVHPFEDMTDDPNCSDFNNNGVIDDDDQNILHLYDWQSCGDPCSAYRLSIEYSPEDSLYVGTTLDYIQVKFENTTNEACYLENITFYATCFGYGNPEDQIGYYDLNLWVAPGASYTQGIVNYTIPPCGLGCIIADVEILDCAELQRVQTCPQRYFECAPEAGTCYDFKTYLQTEAWVFVDPPLDTAEGFIISASPTPGYHSAGDSLMLEICHTEVAVIQDSVIFRFYLSPDETHDESDPLYENVVSVRANNGDVTGDCFVDIDDPVYLIAFIFSGGPSPNPMQIGNVDCSTPEPVDIDDVVYLINYIFAGGAPPEFCPELW